MSAVKDIRICRHFETLEDPRSRGVKHPLVNIVTIAICAVISGAETFTEIEEYGLCKEEWFGKFLDLSEGIPSHDTFNVVIARLNSTQFESCLLSWIESLHEVTDGKLLRLDGKTLRRSYQSGDPHSALHMVSVWCSKNQLSLASQVVDGAGSEPAAMRSLLELIELQGSLVTIDANGTTREIAETIVHHRGDYVLAVKRNQPKLFAAIESFFLDHLSDDFARYRARRTADSENNHGRQDDRFYYLAKLPDEFSRLWPSGKAIGVSIRISQRDGKSSYDTRYYICSRFMSITKFVEAVRGHWSIENQLHWQLDVSFAEDAMRVRNGNAAANMSIMNRTALGLLKKEKTLKRGIKTKRQKCGWKDDYLLKVLTAQ